MHAHIAWVETDAETDRNHEKRYAIHRCINQSVLFLYFFFWRSGILQRASFVLIVNQII